MPKENVFNQTCLTLRAGPSGPLFECFEAIPRGLQRRVPQPLFESRK